LASTTATTTANITAVTLAAIVSAANKTYDRTTGAGLASCTLGNSIRLTWDPNPVLEGVLGYLVQVGTTPGVYTQTYDVGNQTTFVYSTAQPGQTYYFGVTAYNATGNGPTSEVSGQGTVSSVVAGDVVTCAATSVVFATPTVGTGKTVTATGIALSG